MINIREGDIIRSKKHGNWTGEVVKVHNKGYGFLISWNFKDGGHIRTWVYKDDVVLVEKKNTSRYEQAILDRTK